MDSGISSRPIRPPLELMSGFQNYHPSHDALWQRFEHNFFPQHAPKSQPQRELNVELILSPAEALAGGHVSIQVPVAQVCTLCDGTGSTGFFECDACCGHGLNWQAAKVVIFTEPRTRDGAVIPISLQHLGVKNLFLNVHVRVAE